MATNIDQRCADNIRVLSAAMVERAKSGHPGGAMGAADFIHVLFSDYLEFDPDEPTFFFRDRFFLDPGHMSPMLYSALYLHGFYTEEDLKNFRQWGSPTPGHPERDPARMVENTSGPLGQGHTFAVGAAMAERFLAARFGEWTAHKTFAFISDGGIQEEVAQGAGRTAGALGLGNLVMFYDANDIQLSSPTADVSEEDVAKKYEAWGWQVQTIDGHDFGAIREALDAAIEEEGKPSLIIGKTVIGKGALKADGQPLGPTPSVHGQPLSKAGVDVKATIEALGGNPEDPFKVFADVKEHYETVKLKKQAVAEGKRSDQTEYAKSNPEAAAKLESYIKGELPAIDWDSIEQKSGVATRAASSAVLAHFAEKVGNMVVASADLSNSDKTDGFLKKSSIFRKGDFSGAFYQAGVSELTMAAVCTGMALHGGVIPVCATFFVFSDFMKPAIRLASLMEAPVKFVWTHDAFRVGEDGPTHQPIEQEAQIRLLEQLRNHSGERGFLALRPADAQETTYCWKLALEATKRPAGLILSRQDILDLPAKGSRQEEAKHAEHGAYVVEGGGQNLDVILIGNGSEVRTLCEGAELLREKKGLKVRVVSVPSEGLFRDQPEDYQSQVLPYGVPKFGLTAGLPSALSGLVGEDGAVHGLTHFGFSAPYAKLDEEFGFTAQSVFEKVGKMLG